MPLVALRDRLLDLQISPEIGDVLVVHPGEGGIGKDGKIMGAVLGNALAQGAVEILEAPGAEPGLLVRRDVGRIERAERRRQGAAAGEALAVVLGIGVAADAIRRVEDIGAALDSRLVGAARSERRSGEDDGNKKSGRAPSSNEVDHYAPVTRLSAGDRPQR